ncbi:hypothetical protein F7725_013678 [Dissostichus mawsoni]|uniref:FAM13A-like domain-containing protein n=1 Tax=Dissostichus mawsoni TaxID=36200 RepID=A0A7J5YU58_DISMA|nr:hypothetical protein F7725_013678 [Dissostichus mawsoni]
MSDFKKLLFRKTCLSLSLTCLSLSPYIQALKKKVRRFEDQFEQDMKYKPTHNDKYSNPEMIRGAPESLEETVESLFRRLREKRQALNLPDNMKDMTQAQMVLEKITLQKCLLYFESVHGRPGVRQERVLEDVDPTFVSPIVEVKPVQQQADLAVSSLHEASRSLYILSLFMREEDQTESSEAVRDEFYRQTGSPMKEEYQEYKQLKAKLRLLEVLLSKQEVQLGRQESP